MLIILRLIFCVWKTLMPDGSIFPVVRYENPASAAEWLCGACGFHVHHVESLPEGGVAYIVLRFGENFILIGPSGGSIFDNLMVQPANVGNRSTQTCYLTVDNVDAHCRRARAAGAKIQIEPCDEEDGRFYTCRDPEGHLWSFGRPPAGAKAARTERSSDSPRPRRPTGSRAAIGLAILIGMFLGGSAMLYLDADTAPKAMASLIGGSIGSDGATVPLERERRLESERIAAFANKRLAEVEAVAAELADKLQKSRVQLAEALRLKEDAEQSLRASETAHQQQLIDSRKELDVTLRAKEQAAQALEAERQRVLAIENALEEASRQLASLRADGSEEAQRFRADVAQLREAQISAHRAAERASAQLAAAQTSERELLQKLGDNERQTAGLRARVAHLETEQQAAKLKAEQAAETANRALTAAQSKEKALGEKLRATEAELAELHASRREQRATLASIETNRPLLPTAPKGLANVGHMPCGQAVRDIVFRRHPGTEAWQTYVVQQLCDGVPATPEPAKCLSQLLSGKVSWGSGTRWQAKNAVTLCARTQNAAATISCFSRQLSATGGWQSAIQACIAT
jgi:uncharacterized glyoxalase superfamily protein PhnB